MKDLALLAVLFLIPSMSQSADTTYGNLSATVVSIYDGDTMTVNIKTVHPLLGDKIPVRIRGIDTPEMKDPRPDIHEKAVQAKDMLCQACPVGGEVTLWNVGRDKYFRVDADVQCGEVSVGLMLVKAGLAHGDYEGGTKEKW